MCGVCGCSSESAHRHDEAKHKRLIEVEQNLLADNNTYAAKNRILFGRRGIFTLNLVSSPGSGKTTLLVQTIKNLGDAFPIAVIEGDQSTDLDAERIRATGVEALQINTGRACHLDARAISQALSGLRLPESGALFIENVGNLVCPASFDLGEAHKVVVLSVTEGDDKPLKYPDMFHAADLMIINKVDLLPYVAFDVQRCIANARRVNPGIEVKQLSATTSEGMEPWLAWVRAGVLRATLQRPNNVTKYRYVSA